MRRKFRRAAASTPFGRLVCGRLASGGWRHPGTPMQATGCDGRPIFSGGLNDEDSVDLTLPHRLDLKHLHDAPPLAFGVVNSSAAFQFRTALERE